MVKRITREELKERLGKGDVLILDVRTKESHDMDVRQIKGASWISIDDLLARAPELGKDIDIVTYCT